jgi:hypothetical protein
MFLRLAREEIMESNKEKIRRHLSNLAIMLGIKAVEFGAKKLFKYIKDKFNRQDNNNE